MSKPRQPVRGARESDTRGRSIGLLAALGVIVVWTGFILTGRAGISAGNLGPWDMAALRFGVSGLVMLPVLLRYGLGSLYFYQAVTLGCFAGLGFALLVYHGFSFAPAAHGAILLPGTLPLWTALLSIFVLAEPLGRRRILSLGLIASGVAALAVEAFQGQGLEGAWRGDLLLSGACLSWAVYTVLARRWQADPIRTTAFTAVLTAVAFLPVYLVALPSGLHRAGLFELLWQGFYQGICAVVLALFFFTTAVKHLGAATTTIVTAVVPASVTLGAVVLLGEPVTPIALVGVGLVTLGMLATVAVLFERRRPVPVPHS